MVQIEIMKVTCKGCGWEGMNYEVLTAPSPFEEEDTLIACPECKTVDSLLEVCQVDGCRKIATCGTPTDDGYIRCCGDHYQEILKEENKNET